LARLRQKQVGQLGQTFKFVHEEQTMQLRRNHPTLRSIPAALTFAAVVTLMWLLACTSKSSPKSSGEKTVARSSSGQATDDPGINLNCVYDRLQNPPEAFHYIYKKTTSDGSKVDQEADVTPQTIDGFRGQQDGSQQAIHAIRSDSQGWQSALAGLTGISGMSSTVSTFNHNSAMQRESDGGQVNGYQTIHYSIDTARWDATTRQMLSSFTLGPGGFDKGDAWVMADGCPVKLVLDDEMHKKDGTLLETVHYEESMAKK
jgi:hypothetical protein